MKYQKCLVELDEVLSYLSEKDLQKIPEDVRSAIKAQKDKSYIWKYDKNKELKDQNLNRETIAMLSYLNMEYLLNDKQKEFMKNIHKMNEEKAEKEKQEKYNQDNLFEHNTNEVAMLEYKETFIKRLINKIKNLFRKNIDYK